MSQAPFRLPGWASKPRNADTQVRVMKEGTLVKTVPLTDKALLFGRKVPDAPERGTLRCEHDSISREHAVIAHSFTGEAFVTDLGSRFGTTLDGEKIESRKYLPIVHGAKLRFGESTREYVYLTRAPADASSGAPTLAGASGASGAPKPKAARASVDSDDEDPMAAYVDEEDAAAEAAEGAGAARAERKAAKERERARRKEAKAESKLARKEERREEKQRVKEAKHERKKAEKRERKEMKKESKKKKKARQEGGGDGGGESSSTD